MRSTWWFSRATRVTCALVLLALVQGATVAAARPGPGPDRPVRRRALNLFALTNAVLNVNRVFCGINNLGELCVDPTNSPTIPGGFWPKGTPNAYIFNSGLQLAGVVSPTAGGGEANFPWAGDTIGAAFVDFRGNSHGDSFTLVYNSLDPGDAAAWPNGAIIRDTAIYHDVLIGRDNISQQDLWARTWDGNPALLNGRTHPMGVLVEVRGLGWNFPTGNEDIVYFIFTFYNVTASRPELYDNPTILPAVRAEIALAGVQFQQRNELAFPDIEIPDSGYTIQNMFAAFGMDPDVGDALHNYSTAILPFNMAVAYKADFLETGFAYPPNINGAPFVDAPGFVGVKYLRSPQDQTGQELGLTMFSNTANRGTGYPDAVGVLQLFRYLSGTSSPSAGDNPCTFQGQQLQRRVCFLDQTDTDTRFFMASGPMVLPPGEARTIVVAYVHAAPLAHVVPFIGVPSASHLKPLIPFSGDSIADDTTRIRVLERAAGWVTQGDSNSNGSIEQNEVVTVPRSLLDKALVAQAVYDNEFLLPFAPKEPRFFLIPGNDQVTVVWQKSATEVEGDPFFAVASQPLVPDPQDPGNMIANALYDPNFRQFDVEGYRIYRGRTTSQMTLLAQFDYAGTTLIDYTGAIGYPGACAPELGVTADCPAAVLDTLASGAPDHATGAAQVLAGNMIQVPLGGRVELANGSVLIVSADTAVTGAASGGFPALTETGISFSYTDNTVRNSFTYHYAVTAFDVNSFASGPSSLESAQITRAVTPRAPSGQETAGNLLPLELLGADGNPLPAGAPTTVVAATGILSGPARPTDGLELGLAAFLPQILADGSVTVTIDSIVPGAALAGVPGTYYVRAQGAGDPVPVQIPITLDGFDLDASAGASFPATAISGTRSERFGGDATFSLYGNVNLAAAGTWRLTSWGRADINGAPGNSNFNGPRWFTGTNETAPNPNANHCNPGSPSTCGSAGGATLPVAAVSSASRMAGLLVNPGNDTVRIFHPVSYNTVQSVPQRDLEGVTSYVTRAADFRVFWGSAGAIDSVVDLTHRVRVPFKTGMRASWGILNQQSFTAGGTNAATTPDTRNTVLTWTDIFCVAPVPARLNRCGGTAQSPAVLQDTARLSPIVLATTGFAEATTIAATGNGFIFYLNGHFFPMQMAALPPAGTEWNARFYSGTIIGTVGNYTEFQETIRPPAVPGLRATVAYEASTFDPTVTTAAQLERVHTVPDPYYVTSALEISPHVKVLKFVNMPSRAIVRIYSLSGVLVQVLALNDALAGGELTWDLRNRNNQFVASGVYFYHVETPDGKSKVGRFTVVNFAQ